MPKHQESQTNGKAMAKKKARRKRPESELEETFYHHWTQNYAERRPIREYMFHPTRKFRMDFAWPRYKVAVEVQGMGPGHCSLQGMTKDYERHLEALLLNWRIVYLTSVQLKPKNIDDVCENIAKLLDVSPAQKINGYVPLRKRR